MMTMILTAVLVNVLARCSARGGRGTLGDVH